jgi:hypothetical protein
MIVIEIFARGTSPRHRPTLPTRTTRLDTSWRPSLDLYLKIPSASSVRVAPATDTLV